MRWSSGIGARMPRSGNRTEPCRPTASGGPWGKGLLPVRPADGDYDRMERFVFDTRSGAPRELEDAWGVRRTSESHAAAWRIMLVMAVTGQNLLWDILDAEQDREPFTDSQLADGRQAPRQKHGLRVLYVHGYIERARILVNGTHCVWLRLTGRARAQLAGFGIEPIASDWDRMERYHDPNGNQIHHTLHCLLAARLARGRGWEARLMPDEQPQIDLRLTPPGCDPVFVECEARKPSRAVRRLRKWERLSALQGYCAVIATRPRALQDLAREIRLVYRRPCVGADLETLIEDPDAGFWSLDDRKETPC